MYLLHVVKEFASYIVPPRSVDPPAVFIGATLPCHLPPSTLTVLLCSCRRVRGTEMASVYNQFCLLATPVVSVLGLLAFLATLTFYRLFLHPLANVPGPKIAAATAWYEFYWDCPQKGRFFTKITEMHKKYGMHLRAVLLHFLCRLDEND